MRLKQGVIRDDGMVFSQYYKHNGIEKEMWYSPDVFEKIKKRRIQRTIERQKNNKKQHAKNVMDWRKRNPEKSKKSSRESSAAWRKKNPEKLKIKSTINHFKRKAIKTNKLHPNHDRLKEKKLVSIAKILNLQIDHIIPLSRGGWHWHENLRLLPGSLNASKNNRLDCELSIEQQNEIMLWDQITKFFISSFSVDKI